jgi:hypothetical protein
MEEKENEPWTTEEVTRLIIKERDRAVKIARGFSEKYTTEYAARKKAGNDIAFISERKADVARVIGNAISGGNALSLNETMGDRVKFEMKKYLDDGK